MEPQVLTDCLFISREWYTLILPAIPVEHISVDNIVKIRLTPNGGGDPFYRLYKALDKQTFLEV